MRMLVDDPRRSIWRGYIVLHGKSFLTRIWFAASSIHESWDVVKKVHKILEKMTGWYGFTMWGGPNPEIGGELSMKS